MSKSTADTHKRVLEERLVAPGHTMGVVAVAADAGPVVCIKSRVLHQANLRGAEVKAAFRTAESLINIRVPDGVCVRLQRVVPPGARWRTGLLLMRHIVMGVCIEIA